MLIFDGSVSKSQQASIISNPLFIIVAESIVIFAPIFHCGCFRASFLVASAILALSQVRNGPPDAVRWMRVKLFSPAPRRHWNMAECSESTGIIGALYLRARSITTLPPATRVSLLARAITFPAFIAAIVGLRPLNPTNAVRTMSMSSAPTRLQTESIPAKTLMSFGWRASATFRYLSSLQITAAFGLNSRACSMRRSSLLLAVRSSTSKRSLCCLTTSRACLPIEPVEPRIAICLFLSIPVRS